jgi:cytochrome c-type biogenesis protein CcmF
LLLMGIAPLSAWRASTARTLGRAAWKPAVASAIVLVALLATGMRSLGALLGLWLCAFVLLVTIYEFWRGAAARIAHGENPLAALTGLVARNRRRYGGYIIHVGVVLIAIGIIGIEFFQNETQGSIAAGERLQIGKYSMEYVSLAEFQTEDGRLVDRAVVNVYKDEQFLAELHPRRDFFYESQQAMTIPGLTSSLEEDVYILLVEWEPLTAEKATFKMFINPLINWVWVGGLVFIAGNLIAAWPSGELAPLTGRSTAVSRLRRSEA